MRLPADIARCDGLLPKVTRMPNGMDGVLWAHDCPCRETCSRYLQHERDDPARRYPWITHNHGPAFECPDFIQENTEND